MLRVTRVTDYGILLMTQLVSKTETVRLTANDLAQATHIPAPTVSKILQSLLKADLLRSVRGARGGYQLAKTSDDISLRDIIHCLEGRIALTECSIEGKDCEQSEFCSTRSHWQRINQSMLEALASIRLTDMADDDFRPVFSVKRVLPIQTLNEVA